VICMHTCTYVGTVCITSTAVITDTTDLVKSADIKSKCDSKVFGSLVHLRGQSIVEEERLGRQPERKLRSYDITSQISPRHAAVSLVPRPAPFLVA